jgi:antitoxin HicB
MLSYPITVSPDSNSTLLVGFPDIPHANSLGDDREEALVNAVEALEAAIELYFDKGQPVPLPRADVETCDAVSLSGVASSKVQLWNDMLAKKVDKAELARLLGVQLSRVDKLFDLTDTTSDDLVEKAAKRVSERAALRSG